MVSFSWFESCNWKWSHVIYQYLLDTEIIIGMLEIAQQTIKEEHMHQNY